MDSDLRVKKIWNSNTRKQEYQIVETGEIFQIHVSEWQFENSGTTDTLHIISNRFKLDITKFFDELILKYKNHKLYLNPNQLKSLINGGWFSKTSWNEFKKQNKLHILCFEEIIWGFGNDNEGVLFTKYDYNSFTRYNVYFMYEDKKISSLIFSCYEPLDLDKIKISNFKNNDIKSFVLEQDLLIMKKYRVWEDTVLEKLSETKEELNQNKSNVLSELDKDGNGEVDTVEGNDFNLLLKKHQKSIVEVDRNYVQQFVKVSSYLKTKKGNIQSIFNSIKDTPNQEILNEYVEILKDEIHTYNLVLFNSLNMIVSLVEDDMITFYEIYEMFDTLNIFDSKHEKDVSQKLTNIGDGLESLMYEIRDMGDKISNSIQELIYVTEESNRLLSSQLSEIDSTIKVGNLISTINTYQNYKTNRRLNS